MISIYNRYLETFSYELKLVIIRLLPLLLLLLGIRKLFANYINRKQVNGYEVEKYLFTFVTVQWLWICHEVLVFSTWSRHILQIIFVKVAFQIKQIIGDNFFRSLLSFFNKNRIINLKHIHYLDKRKWKAPSSFHSSINYIEKKGQYQILL